MFFKNNVQYVNMDNHEKSDSLLKSLQNFPSCESKVRKDRYSCENNYFMDNVHCKCNSFVVLKLRKHSINPVHTCNLP